MRLYIYGIVMGLISSAAYAQPGIDYASINGIQSPNGNYISPGQVNSISTVFQDDGAGMQYAFFTFDVWPDPQYSCKVGMYMGSPLNQSLVYLRDDNGNPEAGMQVGTGGVEGNSKCQLLASGSSVTQSGGQWTVTVSVIFNDPYNGIKCIYADGYDTNGVASGWYSPNAAFTVYSTDYAPQSISVSPGSGSAPGSQIQTFQVTVHDVNGVQTMWHVEFMFTSQQGGWQYGYAFQPVQRCKVVAEASANLIWVEDDSENGLSPPGFANFGASSPASISSNRCTLYPSMSSQVYTDIDTEVITFAVSFSPTFTGAMYDHMYIADNLGMDHWDSQADGTWTWNIMSMSKNTHATFRNSSTVSPGCSGGAGSPIYVYDDGNPVTYTWTSCDGNGDARYFTSCSVNGTGVTASLSNQSVLSFSTTITAAIDAAPGPWTMTCLWFYGWEVYTTPLEVYNTFYTPNSYYSQSDLDSLAGGVVEYASIDPATGNIVNPQLDPDTFNYLVSNGFISSTDAADLTKWLPIIVEIPIPQVVAVVAIGAGIYITYQAAQALIPWLQARGSHDPPQVKTAQGMNGTPGTRDENNACIQSVPPTPWYKWQAIDLGGQWAGQVHWHWIAWNVDPVNCIWYIGNRMEGLADPGPLYQLIPGIWTF